jgi:hypothetical protein
VKSGTHEATSGNLPVPEAVSPIGTTPTVDSQARTFTTPGRLQQLGRYIILGQLGVGGMSIVHEAYDPELDRKVALKILRGVPGGVSTQGRLLREGQALARINHTNVVRVYDVGIDQGQLFIAMERIDGTTLRAWLASAKRSLAEILRVFISAGRGLAEAHAAGIIHRDFKPKSRRPSQTAPQPTDRPHSRELGRFERVSLLRLAPHCPALPQVLAKRWQCP